MRESPFAKYHLFRNPFGELTARERAELAVIHWNDSLSWLTGDVLTGRVAPANEIRSANQTNPASQTASVKRRLALQVIGPCGHGKSTHLLALQRALTQVLARSTQAPVQSIAPPRTQPTSLVTYIYFPDEGDQPPLPGTRPVLIDEAQRMSWLRRRQLLTGDGPLILGTHVDCSRWLTRGGFEVRTLDVSHMMPPQQLQEILNRRILASRITTIQTGWAIQPPMPCAVAPESPIPDFVGPVSQPEVAYHPLCLTVNQVVALQQRFGSNIRLIEHYLYDAFQRFAEKGEPWLPVN
ncbi:MAG: hypothetical protein IT423_05070 [Pirellulaceae bacterium]|nr:hypothetical protein [Pirellulaceae bacterium]